MGGETGEGIEVGTEGVGGETGVWDTVSEHCRQALVHYLEHTNLGTK